MALQTDDITILNNDTWQEIPLLTNGTFVQIVFVRGNTVNVKVGVEENSKGVKMADSDTFKAPESVYVKVNTNAFLDNDSVLTIIRDK